MACWAGAPDTACRSADDMACWAGAPDAACRSADDDMACWAGTPATACLAWSAVTATPSDPTVIASRPPVGRGGCRAGVPSAGLEMRVPAPDPRSAGRLEEGLRVPLACCDCPDAA